MEPIVYVLLILALITIAAVTLFKGLQRRRWGAVAAGGLVLLGAFALPALLEFWRDWLWFDAVAYEGRFWTTVIAQALAVGVSAVIGFLTVYLLTFPIPREVRSARAWPEFLGTLLGGFWGLANWDVVLRWWFAVDVGVSDPILGRDIGFYLFSLPFWDGVYSGVFWLTLIGLLAVAGSLSRFQTWRDEVLHRVGSEYAWQRPQTAATGNVHLRRALALNAGVLALVLAGGRVLDLCHLMYSRLGAVTGPGWTDVYVRMPGDLVVACGLVVVGAFFLTSAATARFARWWMPSAHDRSQRPRWVFGIGGLLAVWFLALGVTPVLSQWLWVSPNEITVEAPYIEHNIEFTRLAFGLDDIEERQFPVSEELDQQSVDKNDRLLSEVRLWDPRALQETYEQFQEIRLYYEFTDVDIDRYDVDGRYRQVMASPREMEPGNLPRQSQTFVNRHFKYTHGYGLTLAPVSEFTSNGLPDLLVKDIPPVSAAETLHVDRPQIYFGEHTDQYVVVNTREPEFDYPSGEENEYTHYSGTGGVRLSNLWRKFVLGWKFGGTRFFLSKYPTRESRVLFHRTVEDRVRTLAPFLTFDRDPYIVLHEGQLYWIIDAYTTSANYPYSEELSADGAAQGLYGANYVRNSVKAVVDAYDGDVNFYVFEPEDPIIQVWQRIFPGLLRPRSEMPVGLQAHVRYPEGLLTAQGLLYAKYHMTDPAVFYNQEDLWVPAQEKYYADVQQVEPYYVLWEPPDTDEAEFILMQPFTPKNRQVMIGWIAGMCDGENYGRLLAYRFPKERRILGPLQVETKIDQDRFLSGQLTLWDQRGSTVIRGNLLVIPIDDTLLYVEPIYLRAEAAAYPELRLVVLMHGDRLVYAESFDEALRSLLQGTTPQPAPTTPSDTPQVISRLVRQSNRAFEEYLQAMAEKDFSTAADRLRTLNDALDQLESSTSETQASANERGESSSR
ncbi:MAG: UPF0182 family protein [Planctomycetota bacterium]|nr:MAG: UPF0182 family protein [Planctomycetota bacterium]